MEEMVELEKILNEILAGYDLSKSEGREAAYEECIAFAETRLPEDLRCNAFLRMAAQMLEKAPVEFDVIRDMVEPPPNAMLDISYDDRHGFMLTANAATLEYLAELLRLLAEAPEGEHIHLYNDEEPLTPISFNAVIYHEGDEWFERAQKEVFESSDRGAVRKRAIQPEEIFAVQVVGNLPADAPITRDHLYRAEKVGKNIPEYDEEVEEGNFWRKDFSGDPDRLVCVEVTDDFGEDRELVLHLDDPDIIYFKRVDIEQLLE